MLISLVVAASTNNAIGKDNRLLWHLPNDLKFFKNTTWALPVIMGRKTFESMDSKPLNGRLNIIITRQKDWKADGVLTVHSLEEAVSFAQKEDYKECCVIGGGEIFREAMAIANIIYLTRVDTDIDGDVFFPEIDTRQWQLLTEQSFVADSKHAYPYHFQRWERKNSG
jgi:dihydrofolate reductase